jgi:sec-independent protein translocase protein TatA
MGNLGPMELLVIAVVALLVFGGNKMADLGKGLGEGIRNFKKAINEPAVEEPKKPDNPPPAVGGTP